MPQCRQKGYASRLLEEVRKIGAETGATKIHLNVHVNHDRADAHRLYFKNGFEICAYHFRCDPKIIFVEREKSMLKILTAAVLTLSLAAAHQAAGKAAHKCMARLRPV